MWEWLFGSWRTIGYVAVSTILIYASTVLGVRLGERRTLTEMTVFDFAVAIALGAVIARTATTPSPSYVQGLTAVGTLLLVHHLLSWGRLHWPPVRRVLERRPIVLIRDGVLLDENLKAAYMTREDVCTALRERGVGRLADVTLLVLESRGAFSVCTGPVDDWLAPTRRADATWDHGPFTSE